MLQLSVLHLLLERLTACSEARYRLRIGIFAYPTGIRHPHWGGGSHRNIAMLLGTEN